MNPMRDYLGVWPDINGPPDVPFPTVCPRTRVVLRLAHVRYLEYADGKWQIAEHPPEVESVTLDTSNPGVGWAVSLPPHAPRSSKILAARVMNGEYPPEVDAILAERATGEFLGTVGERRTGTARIGTVVRQYPDHPKGGPQYRVYLTIDGRECRWWTGESCWCDDGEEAEVKYTVKRHAVYEGRRVTVVSRVSRIDATKRERPGDAGLADPSVATGEAAEVPDERGT